MNLKQNRVCKPISLQEEVPWHAIEESSLFERVNSSPGGLREEEVKERLKKYGRNLLPVIKPPSFLKVFLHQFASPLIYILLIAGIISILMQDYKDGAFIFIVILLNAAIGTFQEWRAERSAHSLQHLFKGISRVKRSGVEITVDSEEIVPGDLVLLESGEKVPADLRLIETKNLTIDESLLTGESQGVLKVSRIVPIDTPISERNNMAFAASTVLSGRGMGLAVATGVCTQVGLIARSIKEEGGAKPPLIQRMEKFARQISFIVLGFAAFLGFVVFSRGGVDLGDIFILVVAMAVSAIPEGLPVAMTVALSLASSKMAKRNVIVRRLAAVESLGSCTVIATDKTGTLTVNQQTVKKIFLSEGIEFEVSGEGYLPEGNITPSGDKDMNQGYFELLRELALTGALCNEATFRKEKEGFKYSGDPMDVAMLVMAEKIGLDSNQLRNEYKLISVIPFESEKRYSAVLFQKGEERVIAAKGAVEVILPFCNRISTSQGKDSINPKEVLNKAMDYASQGYRVLGMAVGDGNAVEEDTLEERHLKNLIFRGLVCFIDPLRPEAKGAVEKARNAGVRVVMITGDHPATALAIARELGISHSEKEVVTGRELQKIDSPESDDFYQLIKRGSVFARVTPHQKLQIVEGLLKLGHFVAVTGDGVNDAPALKKANIGVAMGSGTDLARDTSSMIVTDDNFASIVAGIEEGRFAYANVRKVILLLISTGLAELVLLGTAILLNFPIPLIAIQILWMNLVTNGIQDVALAFEAGEAGVMNEKPRSPKEGIFNKKMIELIFVSGLTMAVVSFVYWVFLMNQGVNVEYARGLLLSLMVLMQSFHVLNCRSECQSVFRIPFRNNPVLIIGMIVALGLHIFATENRGLQSLLRLESIPLGTWVLMAAMASSVLITMETYKFFCRRIRRANPTISDKKSG